MVAIGGIIRSHESFILVVTDIGQEMFACVREEKEELIVLEMFWLIWLKIRALAHSLIRIC